MSGPKARALSVQRPVITMSAPAFNARDIGTALDEEQNHTQLKVKSSIKTIFLSRLVTNYVLQT